MKHKISLIDVIDYHDSDHRPQATVVRRQDKCRQYKATTSSYIRLANLVNDLQNRDRADVRPFLSARVGWVAHIYK